MKLFCAILLLLTPTLFAQEKATTATTEDGRKVLLSPDGTWRLASTSAPSAIGGSGAFQKPETAKLFVKAPKGPFGVWINQEKWKQNPPGEDVSKFTLDHKNGDAFAMIIAERIGMRMESLKKLAISNAKQAAPDIKVVSEEKRVVNGKELLCMKLSGTLEGMSFIYYGYYYSGTEGTLQVVAYTGANLFDEFKQDFEDFLNGTQIGSKG